MCITRRAQQKSVIPTVILLVILAAAVLPSQAAAAVQASKPVSLYLDVEEKDKLIQGLNEKNFRLFEDGEPRSFRLEKPETPMEVVLLVEYSQRSWFYFNDIQDAMQAFMDVAPEGNWYSLVTFSHGSTIQVDFTQQKGRITDAFSDLGQPLWDETDTYDAVYDVLERLRRLPGRRVLIFIGSGFDTFSRHTLEDVEKLVESTNVVIYGLGAGSALRGYYEPYLGAMRRMDLFQAEAFLRMLAEKSGGQAWFPNFEAAFYDVMKGVTQDLANQYRLVYTPRVPADKKFHKIRVEAFRIIDDKRQDFKVRVRQGWRF